MHEFLLNPDYTLNLEGLRCPEPLMMIRQFLRHMSKGQTLLIITDDKATKRDIPTFCYFMNHILLNKNIENIPYQFLLKKETM